MTKILQNQDNAVDLTAKVLLDGGVVALPTETVYGLVTLWNNETGRERIYQMKNRPASKLLQMLAADIPMAEIAGLLTSPELEKLGRKYWPGALTVVASAADGSTIGLRIPDHEFLLQVLKKIRQPLAATSANLSGEPAALTAEDAVKHLVIQPDLVVDGGPIPHSPGASTVVALADGQMKILRQGTIVPEI